MAYQNGKTYYVIPLCATGDAAYNQKILNKQVQPLALNIQGTGDHYNNRNVNVYSLDWSTDMQWYLEVPRDAGYARFHCKGNPEYGLDYYYGSSNPGNCDIYKIIGNEEDSKINFRTVNASENIYRIQCYRNNADNDLYLTATGASNGADVRWQPLDSSKAAYQTWWLVPIENVSANTPATPTVPTTPNEIKDHEFFVKAYGTNLYLNVHGTDTVANARNVNVYAKDNCLAQKWIAKQTTAGPKLFTSINQAYALNINTADNNCTMYTASGNDTDSVLAFEEVADMLYRIKMNNHNKYLRVDAGATSGSNVYWVSDINSATYWEFIPEDVIFPAEPEVPSSPDAPTAIVGNTYAVQANGTSYYLNVYGTDTVADGRNVNIYSKEDCLAQRWVIRNTENGPKLFTKINENFALNIDTSTDNCSMYTAAGNDNDSLLEFSSVGNMLYRIKMYNHNKYLCIDGTAATGTNVKWIEGATFATVWKLVPEENITDGDAVFIRKLGTQYPLVFSTSASSEGSGIIFSNNVSESQQKWIIKNTTEGKEIVNASNTTQNLRLNSDNTAFVVSSNVSLSKAYLTEDGEGSGRFTIRAIANNIGRSVTYMWLAVVAGVVVASDDPSSIEKIDLASTADKAAYSSVSYIPSKLQNRRYKLKNNNKYIAFDETINAFSAENNTTEANQVFFASEYLSSPCIVCVKDTGKFLSINPLTNAVSTELPMVDNIKVGLDIQFEEYLPDKYFIHSLRYDKFLFIDTGDNKLKWGNIEELSTQDCIWEFVKPDYINLTTWLKADYNPIRWDNKRTVPIPNYAYRLPIADVYGNFTGDYNYISEFSMPNSDGVENAIKFKFTDNSYWFAQEGTKSGEMPRSVIDKYQLTENDEVGPCVAKAADYNGFYAVAVGPSVIDPSFDDFGRPGNTMYGVGILDAVIEYEGVDYYIHCIPADIKAHTWNNGVIQTYLRYFNPGDNIEDTYDITTRNREMLEYIPELEEYTDTYDRTVAIEFIGNNGFKSDGSIYLMPEPPRDKYYLKEIIFYPENN